MEPTKTSSNRIRWRGARKECSTYGGKNLHPMVQQNSMKQYESVLCLYN